MLPEAISFLTFFLAGGAEDSLGAAPAEGVVLVDGREMAGRVLALKDGGVLLEGVETPIPLYELNSIVLERASPGDPSEAGTEAPDFDAGPMLRFRDGASLRGRVLLAGERVATVEVEPPETGPGKEARREKLTFRIPLEAIRAFRLREASRGDQVFEEDLSRESPPQLLGPASVEGVEKPPPAEAGSVGETELTGQLPRDLVYVRRSGGALRVEGLFQSLDDEYLTLILQGEPRRIRRQLVLGVILAPVATSVVETEVPAVFDLEGVGGLPAFLRGLQGEAPRRRFAIRFAGAPPGDVEEIPEGRLRLVRFSSDRVVFLSALDPIRVEQVPFIGSETSLQWQKDKAVGGGPLRLGGRTYRKGLGVHSRNVIEYDLQARYRSLAGVIGLDESAGPRGSVTFRVFADSKEIFSKEVGSGDPPETISLPADGVRRLRLEVDYGPDGVDFGDCADWADLRVTR
jgi:hypothetical protein